jgi:hypothetical protein
MDKETRWGSFQNFLTWRDWMAAFVSGFLTILAFFAFAVGRTLGDFVFFLIFAAIGVRVFLTFRRKVKVLINIADLDGD